MWQIAYPYKIQFVHELKPADPGKYIAICNWLLRYVSRSHSVLDTVFFSDEAWFHLSGYVNAQNYHVWSSINPHEYVETTLHPQKLGLWCAISRKCFVGPIFFQRHHFRSLSIHYYPVYRALGEIWMWWGLPTRQRTIPCFCINDGLPAIVF